MRRFIEGLRDRRAAKAVKPLTKEERQFVDEFITRRFDVDDALRQNPYLLTLVVPELVDESGRVFKNIPLLKYMLWTGDRYGMSTFLLDTERVHHGDMAEVCEKLLKQLEEFKKSGVTFTHGDTEYTHHAKYSDQAHIDVLEQYVKMCEDNCTLEERKEFWIKTVGKTQKMVELHIALKLCHVDKTPFHLLSIFPSNEKIAKPIWFPLSESKLGEEYAICASSTAFACEAPEPAFVKLMIEKLKLHEHARGFHVESFEKDLNELMKVAKDKLVEDAARHFSI